MSRSTFIGDLNARIQESQRIISEQNEYLTALRHLLDKETGPSTPAPVTPPNGHAPEGPAGIDFKGRTSDIVLALVTRSGGSGTRPRDIAEILVAKKLVSKGSNTVHSHLSELKKKGLVQQNSAGLYIGSSKSPAAVPAVPATKARKKRKLSAAGREAIRNAQKARWAAVKKAK